jgi:hypothetical protein
MSARVGVDLVSVEDVRESIARCGRAYLDRLYTERELRDIPTAGGCSPQRSTQPSSKLSISATPKGELDLIAGDGESRRISARPAS